MTDQEPISRHDRRAAEREPQPVPSPQSGASTRQAARAREARDARVRKLAFGGIVVAVLAVGGVPRLRRLPRPPGSGPTAGVIDVQSSMAGLHAGRDQGQGRRDGDAQLVDRRRRRAPRGRRAHDGRPGPRPVRGAARRGHAARDLDGARQARHLRRLVRDLLRRQGQPRRCTARSSSSPRPRPTSPGRPSDDAPTARPRRPGRTLREHRLVLGWPLPAVALAALLATVGITASAYVLAGPVRLRRPSAASRSRPSWRRASSTASTRARSPCSCCSRPSR